MGKRLSKIYTRTGDDGTTGLGDGSRVAKDALRVQAMGDVDEVNSAIGIVLAEDLPAPVHATLLGVQHDLLDLGGELCLPGHTIITEAHVARIEQALDAVNAALPPLEEFLLPGGSRAAAAAHHARTVCRRAERTLVALAREEALAPALMRYVNRLSDYLFVAARALNRHADQGDVLWEQGRNRKA